MFIITIYHFGDTEPTTYTDIHLPTAARNYLRLLTNTARRVEFHRDEQLIMFAFRESPVYPWIFRVVFNIF